MNVSLRTKGAFPNLTGTYTIQIVRNPSSDPVDLTILIEQEAEKIFLTAKLDSFSVASIPRVLRGRIADRTSHYAVVEFENGDWERYVFSEGRFSKHEFLF